MSQVAPLNQEVIHHWKQLRQMTYDLLEIIAQDDLPKKLPFESSQSLGNQFYCIVGTTETFIHYLETGVWTKWSCSLNNGNDPLKEDIQKRLEQADEKLLHVLSEINLMSKDLGKETPLQRYLTLVEHESLHQGQMINFIFALNIEIPTSWKHKWALKRQNL